MTDDARRRLDQIAENSILKIATRFSIVALVGISGFFGHRFVDNLDSINRSQQDTHTSILLIQQQMNDQRAKRDGEIGELKSVSADHETRIRALERK